MTPTLALSFLLRLKFAGAIPAALGQLRSLELLRLTDNLLSGAFARSHGCCALNEFQRHPTPGDETCRVHRVLLRAAFSASA